MTSTQGSACSVVREDGRWNVAVEPQPARQIAGGGDEHGVRGEHRLKPDASADCSQAVGDRRARLRNAVQWVRAQSCRSHGPLRKRGGGHGEYRNGVARKRRVETSKGNATTVGFGGPLFAPVFIGFRHERCRLSLAVDVAGGDFTRDRSERAETCGQPAGRSLVAQQFPPLR